MPAGYSPLTPLRVQLVSGKIAEKRQTAGMKFTHRPKISIFALLGRLVAPIYVKLGTAKGNLSLFGCVKFHMTRCMETTLM